MNRNYPFGIEPNKRITKRRENAITQYFNLKMFRRKKINGIRRGTLGSYLNRGNINRILKIYKKKI